MRTFEIVYAQDLEKVLRESRGILIDIRDRGEYLEEHWPGAVNYPYDMIENHKVHLPKNRKLVMYCEHGGGSMQMARTLGQEGYKTASVVGGYEAMKKVQENYFKNRRNV